jgi:peptide/nickel transport system ATP-binding protein
VRKTTLGRMVVRLEEPTSGRIFFDGRDLLDCGRAG